MIGTQGVQKTPPELRANAKWGDRAIAIAHAVICALVALVYGSSPAPTDRGDAALDAVWLSIAALALVTIWRGHVTRTRPLKSYEAGAAAGLVFLLLFTVVLSYQARYDLAPALNLRAPTLVFLFVLLALEGLRFNRAHVVLAGSFALLGWVGVAGFAVWDAGPAGVTRDYKTFLTEPKILIGAVVEMALAICLMTGAIAVAVWRGRILLAGLIASNGKTLEALDRQQDLFQNLEIEIAERSKANAALETLANFDPLTGLPNAHAFKSIASEFVQSVKRGDTPGFTVFRVDLDGFRLFNDGFGYEAGDAALIGAAKLLADVAPSDAKIARIGADEFALTTSSASTFEDARDLASSISRTFAQPFQAGEREFGAGATIGAAVYLSGDRAACVSAYANMALNTAKQSGRRGVHIHDPETRRDAKVRLTREADLRNAIHSNGLELHYQPIVDLRSGELAGWEALARWRDETGRFIPPTEFIPIAEDTGAIVELGAWALEEAANAAKAFQAAGAPETAFMSVNVSPIQLLNGAVLVKAVERALSIYPNLKLEVTESSLVDNPARARELLSQLKDLGATLALDDFGTGASSLAMLGQFPFNTLKIDRSFVIDRSAQGLAFLQCIIGLARGLNLDTVAEGLEDAGDHAKLTATGAVYGQGYGLSKPMPYDEVVAELASSSEPLYVAS